MFVSPAVTRGEQSLRENSHPGGGGYHHPDHGAGARTYAVASVEKVSVNDSSGTAATTDNRVTLYTCGVPLVRDRYPAGIKASADCVRPPRHVVWFGLHKPHHITKRRNRA